MPEIDHTITTPARYPASPRPPGTMPVPLPEPWVPSNPTPAPEAKPSRRGVMFATAKLFALGGVAAGATVAAASAAVHPDAELFAVLAEFEALERQSDARFEQDSPSFIEDDDLRDVALAPIVERQEPLLERICTIRATTPEGWQARVRTLAVWDKDFDPGEDAMLPGHYWNARMLAALLRDVLGGA